MDDLRTTLLQRAFCYDDPAAYRAGVDAALAAVSQTMSPESRPRSDIVDTPPRERVG